MTFKTSHSIIFYIEENIILPRGGSELKKFEIFGDSIMRGVIYSEEKGKYKLCNDHKFTSFINSGITVTNNARMGFTIRDGLNAIKKRISYFEPESIVMLSFGGNDCDFNWKEISENPKGLFEPNTKSEDFISMYSDAIDLVRKKGATPVICNIIPIDAEKYMSWISRGLDKSAILKWLGDVSMLSRWQEYYNIMLDKIAIIKNCELLDIRSVFLRSHNFKSLLGADGIHPTQLGYDIIKKEIIEFIA